MRVCFVGIGSIAKRHIKNLRAVCLERNINLSIDALRRKSSTSKVPEEVMNIYTSPEEMPRNYDVIFLTNPTEYHADMLIKLHDYARHFFVEKPITSYETIDKLEHFIPRAESVYYIACPLRYTSVIQYLKENIDIESVNCVRSISSSYLPDWRPGVDYRNTYSAHKALGGGVEIDLIHEWDYLVYMFGMPNEIQSFAGKVSNLEIDSNDYAVYIAKYNNMIVELHLDYFGKKNIRKIEIFTDDDTIIGDFIRGEIRYINSNKTVNLYEERDEYQKREMRCFIDIINMNMESQNSIDEAINILKLTKGVIG